MRSIIKLVGNNTSHLRTSRPLRNGSRKRGSIRKGGIQLEALETRDLLTAGNWVATFGGVAPAATIEEQTQVGRDLLTHFGVSSSDVNVVSALDLSGAFHVTTDVGDTASTVENVLNDVPGFIYVTEYTEPSVTSIRKVQPARARAESIFGPFDYNDFLSREKNGLVPNQSGPVTDFTTDALTNNNSGSTGTAFFTQSETAIVAFGNTVLVGFNDSGSVAGGANKFTGWSRSTDGGSTFTDGGTLPTNAVGDAGDPVLARDEVSGRIYFSTLGFNNPGNIQMFRSDDGGATWLPPVNATPGSNNQDKQWHVVDNFAGPGQGNVYLVTRDFGAGNGIYFYRSTDGGNTFGPNGGTLITSGNQGAYVAVGPDHSVYAFWYGGASLFMRRSTDFGVTFGAPVTVATGLVGGGNGDLGLTGTRQGTVTPSAFRSNEFPHAAVHPTTGQLYVTYNNNPPGSDRSDVFVVTSEDNGATWSAPILINDDGTSTDQWQPTLAVVPDGSRLGVFYHSRQVDVANNNLFRYWGRIATISGTTLNWQPSFAISDVDSLPEFGRDSVVNSVYMGDYNSAVATPGAFHVVWSDNQDDLAGGAGRKDPNVYYEKLALGLSVVSTVPAGGATVNAVPTSYVVNFTDPVAAATVDASDFTVDGIPATSFTIGSPTQVTFEYASAPFSAQGVHTMAMAAGAVGREGSNDPVLPFSGTFRFDAITLQVVSTQPPVNGVLDLPSPLTYDVTFNEPVDPLSVQASDLGLAGIPGAVVTSAVVLPGNQTVRFTLGNISDEGQLTTTIAANAITDAFGNSGTAFSGTYTTDYGTRAYPVPLDAKMPLGSLIYDPSVAGIISPAGDSDNFTIGLDAGQTLSIIVTPTSPGLQPRVELIDPANGSMGFASAPAAGLNTGVQTRHINAAGVYTINVRGVAGTTGGYTVQVILNSAFELEGVVAGASNNALATAQNMDNSFIPLSPSPSPSTRGAVLGTTTSFYTASAVPFAFEDISATGSVVIGAGSDDASASVPIGFNFPFFGVDRASVFVSSNGLVAFGSSNTSFSNSDLTINPPQAAIAVFHDDLNTGSGRVYAQVVGAGVNQHLTLQWHQVRFFSGGNGDTLTFQVQLFADGRIQTNYLDLVNGGNPGDNGASATVGLKDAGTQGNDRLLLAFNNGPNAFVGTGQSTLITYNQTPDIYSFSATVGQQVSLAVTKQVLTNKDVAIQLLDAANVVLATGVSGSTNLTKHVENFAIPATGTYFIRVQGGPSVPYSVVVTRDAALDTEPNDNDLFSTPQPLANARGALGAIAPTLTYVAESLPFAFDDISTTGTVFGLSGADDNAIAIPIGFAFPFFGSTYTSVGVSSNGLLTFGGTDATFSNSDLTSGPSLASIATFWDDLHTSGGTATSDVYYEVQNPGGPNERLTIQWNKVRFFSGLAPGDTLTFQAQLFADGRIQLNYSDLVSGASPENDGASATVGIKGPGPQGPDRVLLALNNGPNSFVGTGKSTLIRPMLSDDWYSFTAVAGEVARFTTRTPGDGPFEPVNLLDPHIELYTAANVLVAASTVLGDGRNESIISPPLTAGTYLVRVTSQGNTQGDYFLERNFAPEITAFTASPSPVAEDGFVTASGTFSDYIPNASPTLTIHWGTGEGSSNLSLGSGIVSLGNGLFSFTASHQYLDDNPTVTGFDNYTVSATLTDSLGSTDSESRTVTVNNVNPVAGAITGPVPGPAVAGQLVSFSSSFTDVGTKDTHTAVFNWGDSTTSAASITELNGSGTASASHVFTATGTYLVTLTLTDDDGGVSVITQSIVVTNAAIQPDPCEPGKTALVVGGTTGTDQILLSSGGAGIQVIINNAPQGVFFPTGRLIVYGQAGDDLISLSPSITRTAHLYGNDGRDRLVGGSGNNLLMGGNGDDILNGGSQRNIMIGGAGRDIMTGRGSDDILIGGTTAHDANDAALCAIMDEWTSTRIFKDRADNINGIGVGPRLNMNFFLTAGVGGTVVDDGESDTESGFAGVDWFFLGLGDVSTDFTPGERLN